MVTLLTLALGQTPDLNAVRQRALGDWVQVAPIIDNPPKLTLRSDGTWTLELKNVVVSRGTFTLAREELFGRSQPLFTLRAPASGSTPGYSMRLMFDTEKEILSDLSFAFARPEAAKAIFEENRQRKKNAPRPQIRTTGWRELWRRSAPGFQGQVVARGSEIAVPQPGRLLLYSAQGRLLRSMPAPGVLGGDVAWGATGGKPYWGLSNSWTVPLRAVVPGRGVVWSLNPPLGINQVARWPMAAGEVGMAIGLNGGGGIWLVNPAGKVVRRIGGLGNTWGVATIQTRRGTLILAAENRLRVFTSEGAELRGYPSEEVGAVATGNISGDSVDEIFTLGVTVSSGLRLTALTAEGKRLWSVKADESPSSFAASPIFTMRRDGQTVIGVTDGEGITFFSASGKRLGRITIPLVSATAVRTGAGDDTLVVRTRKDEYEAAEIVAYRWIGGR